MKCMSCVWAASLSACAATSLTAAPTASELDRQVRELDRANRSLMETMTLGQSREGRPVHLIRLGAEGNRADGPDDRPALLIVAGANADHQVGTDVALGLAQSLVADHADLLERTTVYIVPRLNPDGAALHLEGNGPRRSFSRTTAPDDADGDGRIDEDGPDDVNGDGVITMMRVKNPPSWMTPTLVADADEPRLMRAPKPEEGEIAEYVLLVESRDADGDGAFGEDGLGGVELDMNFMHQWPEHADGAGDYPLSSPEALALARWMLDRPNIAATLVFGPHDTLVKIPDAGKMDITGEAPVGIENGDKAIYEKVSEVFKEITKMKAAPGADSKGAFHAWAYAQYGVPSFSTPVWVRPDQLESEKKEGGDSASTEAAPANRSGGGDADAPSGAPTTAEIQAMVAEFQAADAARQQEMMAQARSMDPVTRRRVMAVAQGLPDPGAGDSGGSRRKSKADENDIAWLKYSDDERDGAGFIEWTTFEHPQLGTVEIGGFVPGFKVNPPEDEIDRLVQEQTAFAMELMNRLPRLSIGSPTVEAVGRGVWRVSIEATNAGSFPTMLAIAEKVRRVPGMTMLLDIDESRILAGDKMQQQRRIDGSGGKARAEWLITGSAGDAFDIVVRSPAIGERRVTVNLND